MKKVVIFRILALLFLSQIAVAAKITHIDESGRLRRVFEMLSLQIYFPNENIAIKSMEDGSFFIVIEDASEGGSKIQIRHIGENSNTTWTRWEAPYGPADLRVLSMSNRDYWELVDRIFEAMKDYDLKLNRIWQDEIESMERFIITSAEKLRDIRDKIFDLELRWIETRKFKESLPVKLEKYRENYEHLKLSIQKTQQKLGLAKSQAKQPGMVVAPYWSFRTENP